MKMLLTILQYLTILVVGLLGWFGLRTTYKSDNGTVTKAGRKVLAWIFISVVIGLVAHTLEVSLENSKERQNEQQSITMLQEIKRAVTKTRIVKLGFDLQVSPNDPQFGRYLDRLRSTGQGQSNFGSFFYGELLPDWKQETEARVALDQLNFSIWIFRKAENKSCPPPLVNQVFDSDFRFRMHVGTSPMFLNHTVSPDRWWIEVRNINLQDQYVINGSFDHGKNSKLQSIKDLEEACVVAFINGRNLGPQGIVPNIETVTGSSLEVTRLILQLEDDQVISCDSLQRSVGPEGYVFFACTLPDSL
jgi:hypothetical protein